jgi:hypothetical protein
LPVNNVVISFDIVHAYIAVSVTTEIKDRANNERMELSTKKY